MKNCAILTLILSLGSITALAANENMLLTVTPDHQEQITGEAANALLKILPPSGEFFAGDADAAQLENHFRKLTIALNAGGPVLTLECSSAAWANSGFGRSQQFKLVSDTPSCTIAYQASASSSTPMPYVIKSLADAIAAGKKADALNPPPLPAPAHQALSQNNDPCYHSRICN